MTATVVPDSLDPRVRLKSLLSPPREPVLVDVPELVCLMIDGRGGPESGPAQDAGFQQAIGAIYPVAYGLHFAFKKDGIERSIMPLEALWWSESGQLDLSVPAMAGWNWRLIMVVPDETTPARYELAVAEARRKKELPGLDQLRLERWTEGRSAQVMYVGPYAAEGPTIERLHRFIEDQGLRLRGYHHEIYMGDPRRAAPEKLKTIIRQPVE